MRPAKATLTSGRLLWEDRDSDKEIPLDYNCREKWSQHSQELFGPQDNSISARRRPKCGHLISKDQLLWMIIALFYLISFNRMKTNITPKSIDAFYITAFPPAALVICGSDSGCRDLAPQHHPISAIAA